MSEDVKNIFGDDVPINNGRTVIIARRTGTLEERVQYIQNDRISPGDINDYDKYDDQYLPATGV